MKYIDLSQTFNVDMSLYPNSQPPIIEQIASAKKDGYNMMHFDITNHLGTHLDAPGHMIENGKCIHQIPLEKFQGKGIVIDCTNHESIGINLIKGKIEGYDVVLFYSGWEHKYFDKEYYFNYPVLTNEAAIYITETTVRIVGVDYFSVDPIDATEFSVHHILLSKEFILYENICNLSQLVNKEFHFYGFPILVEADGFPVRPVAVLK